MAFVLSRNGFKHVLALKGGYNAWTDAGGATVPKPRGLSSQPPPGKKSPPSK